MVDVLRLWNLTKHQHVDSLCEDQRRHLLVWPRHFEDSALGKTNIQTNVVCPLILAYLYLCQAGLSWISWS